MLSVVALTCFVIYSLSISAFTYKLFKDKKTKLIELDLLKEKSILLRKDIEDLKFDLKNSIPEFKNKDPEYKMYKQAYDNKDLDKSNAERDAVNKFKEQDEYYLKLVKASYELDNKLKDSFEEGKRVGKEVMGKVKDAELQSKDIVIENLQKEVQKIKDAQSVLNPLIGADFESWCENQMNEALGAFDDVHVHRYKKETTKGKEADFIIDYLNKHNHKKINFSVVVECKTETIDGTFKTKNKKHIEALLANTKKKKNALFGILVTTLEKENVFTVKKWNLEVDQDAHLYICRPFYLSAMLLVLKEHNDYINKTEETMDRVDAVGVFMDRFEDIRLAVVGIVKKLEGDFAKIVKNYNELSSNVDAGQKLVDNYCGSLQRITPKVESIYSQKMSNKKFKQLVCDVNKSIGKVELASKKAKLLAKEEEEAIDEIVQEDIAETQAQNFTDVDEVTQPTPDESEVVSQEQEVVELEKVFE